MNPGTFIFPTTIIVLLLIIVSIPVAILEIIMLGFYCLLALLTLAVIGTWIWEPK